MTLKDGSYAIFHIGDGTGGPDGGNNCTSGSRAKFLQPEQQQHLVKETQRQTIHIATDLNGPWKPLSPNTLPGCNNPAPWVQPTHHIQQESLFFSLSLYIQKCSFYILILGSQEWHDLY